MTDFMKDLFYWVLVVRTFELLKKCESCYIDLDRSIRKGKTFTGRTWTEILQHPKPRNGMWNWGEELSPAPGSVSTPLTDSGVGYLPFPRPYLSMWCVDSIYINVFRCCFPSHMFFFLLVVFTYCPRTLSMMSVLSLSLSELDVISMRRESWHIYQYVRDSCCVSFEDSLVMMGVLII